VRFAVAVSLLAAVVAGAAGPAAASPPLRVGVFALPPLAMKTAAGGWEGISIDLWQSVARELGTESQWVELDPDAAVAALTAGLIDVVAAPMAVTPERERVVDFTHMFYASGLGIAVPHRPAGLRWLAVIRVLLSPGFLAMLLGLATLLAVAGTVAWLVERRRNPAHFGGDPLSGIGAGVWWSSVTFTGVGYGDKIPVTVPGRIIAVVWMLCSVVLVSAFTGFVTAHVALSHLERIQGPADLSRFRVAVVRGVAAEDYLVRERIQGRRFEDLPAALQALARGELDGVVHGEAALRYEVQQHFAGGVDVLPSVVEREYYAFAVPEKSPWRERVNLALLAVMSRPVWRDIQYRYLGR
jgi:ABC-type amino acid transport substrate-binding protein